ncbi:MAG TPA: sugar phosphate isomerase/epimerase family protein [Pseudorhodoplanes sp.]|jgi:sugar phosphate isomerase/epimerase|nr:sugar phosphate isomerase/epimerase family protein [Pseudorhodoplanes sp.]
MADLKRLSFNQVTALPQWSLKQAIEGLARHDVRGISVWREKMHEAGVKEAARMLEGEGMRVSGLCFAGLISSPDESEAKVAIDDVRRAIEEAAAIKADCLVFVAGGIDPRDKNIARTRARVLERLPRLIDDARKARVKIALEPLHPMTCATRSVISNVKIANDWCDALKAEDVFGIAVDSYVVWWDPDIEREIARAGKRIAAFHVNDWLVDTQDIRLDRGMMGDGVIDLPWLRGLIDRTGYDGLIEVEIFSAKNWWKKPADEVVRVVKERFVSAV